jgi:hypothetical protein
MTTDPSQQQRWQQLLYPTHVMYEQTRCTYIESALATQHMFATRQSSRVPASRTCVTVLYRLGDPCLVQTRWRCTCADRLVRPCQRCDSIPASPRPRKWHCWDCCAKKGVRCRARHSIYAHTRWACIEVSTYTLDIHVYIHIRIDTDSHTHTHIGLDTDSNALGSRLTSEKA